ncbi:MAG TPA: RNA 2',3'-cyclic phosphodiesterase [Steroidobacteraceae bacterium]|jgi:2'-5' RNA ligase
MRLFFAAFLDSESRRSVSAAVRALELEGASAYLPPEKYHMTLVFIGGVSDSVVQAVREIGEAQRVECVSLRFDRWEFWDGARAVVASSPDRPEPLIQLRASLSAGLMHRGVAFDDKPLRPHITVARKLAQAPVLPKLSEFSCTLRAFSLVSSVTAPGGSVYTVVDSWPLLDTAARR